MYHKTSILIWDYWSLSLNRECILSTCSLILKFFVTLKSLWVKHLSHWILVVTSPEGQTKVQELVQRSHAQYVCCNLRITMTMFSLFFWLTFLILSLFLWSIIFDIFLLSRKSHLTINVLSSCSVVDFQTGIQFFSNFIAKNPHLHWPNFIPKSKETWVMTSSCFLCG